MNNVLGAWDTNYKQISEGGNSKKGEEYMQRHRPIIKAHKALPFYLISPFPPRNSSWSMIYYIFPILFHIFFKSVSKPLDIRNKKREKKKKKGDRDLRNKWVENNVQKKNRK